VVRVRVVAEFFQDVGNRAQLGQAAGGVGEKVQDVFAQPDEPAQGGAAPEQLEVFGFDQVVRVIDEHLDGGAVAAQRDGITGFEEFEVEVFEEAALQDDPVVIGHEGTAVEAAQGLAEGGGGDAVGVEQDGFDVAAFPPRLGNGRPEFVGRQQLLLQQIVKFGRASPGQLYLVPHGQPQGLGNFRDETFVLRSKAAPTALVEEEEHTHQVFL